MRFSENLLAVNAILGMNSTVNNNVCQRDDILSIRKMDYKEYYLVIRAKE